MSARADRWIKWTTTGCVALLALIAGTVSYLHMHTLVASHGQPGWVAALTPISVNGMIVAASTTLLADSRSGRRPGGLPWALLLAGSVASLAANVAVAEPTAIGRIIAAWPSFALTASYELLTRQVRGSAAKAAEREKQSRVPQARRLVKDHHGTTPGPVLSRAQELADRPDRVRANDLQRHAWQWALANPAADGALPSGTAIARQFSRHERWGRLVKRAGQAGAIGIDSEPGPRR